MRIKTRLGNLIVEANPITEKEASMRDDLSVLSTVQIDDKIYTLGTIESEDDPLVDTSNEVVFLQTNAWRNQSSIQYTSESTAVEKWEKLRGYINKTWDINNELLVEPDILLLTYFSHFDGTSHWNTFQFGVVKTTMDGRYYIGFESAEPDEKLFLFKNSVGYGIYRLPETTIPQDPDDDLNLNFFVKTSLDLGTTAGTAFDGAAGDALVKEVDTLQSYFSNTKANYAIADQNGNVFEEHYQTIISPNNKITVDCIEGLAEGLVIEDEIKSDSNQPVQSDVLYARFVGIDDEIDDLWADKQDKITANNRLDAGLLKSWINVKDNTIPYTKIQDAPPIPEGVIVDSALSTSSTNPVQNKIVTEVLNKKQNTIDESHKLSASYISGLKTIATQGLQPATASSLGGIKVGDHLVITTDGKLSVDVTDINEGYITQTETDKLYVPLTRTINGKSLTGDIKLGKSDVDLGNVANVGTISSVSKGSGLNVTSGAVFTELEKKQNKLTADNAGAGITISESGIISSTAGLPIQGPYTKGSLPKDPKEGYIYLELTGTDSKPDVCIEYIWSSELNSYERIGSTEVNLIEYVKKDRTIAGFSLENNITTTQLQEKLKIPSDTINHKQNKLTAGSGIVIANDTISVNIDNKLSDSSVYPVQNKVVTEALNTKQNIINEDNKLSFDLIDGGPDLSGYATTSWVENQNYLTTADIDAKADKQDVEDALAEKQDTLISGTTLKTINGESLLGSGNLIIAGGEGGDNNLGIRSVMENPEGPVISAPDTLVSRIYVKQTFTEDEAYQLLYALPVLGSSGDTMIRMSWIFMRVHTTIDPETNEEVQIEESLAIIALQTFNGSDGIVMMMAPNDTTYELKYDEDTGLLAWKDSSDNLIPEYFEINGYGLDRIPEELAGESSEEAAIINVIGIGTNNYQLMPFVWTERTDPPRLGTLTYLEEDVYPKTLLENIYLTPTKPASLATTKDLDGLRTGFVMTSERISDIETQLSDIDTDITNLQTNLASKQNKLTAGEGIDITNNVISATSIAVDAYTKQEIDDKVQVINESIDDINTALDTKQATLVSGTNIKTINNQSLLGEGNITIEGGDSGSAITELFVESDDDGDMVLGLRVSEVQATIEINPSETPTATLDSIKINDIVYDCTENGGGGTNVEANPTDTVTDTLTSLKVSNITYAIPTVDEEAIYESINSKQDKLTTGDNISITNNVISATIPTIITDYGNTLLTNVSSDFTIDFSHFYQIGDLMFAHIVGSTTKSVSSATVKVLGTLTRKPQHLHSFAYATTRGDTFTQASDGASVDTDGTIRLRLTSNASASTYTFDLSFFYCVDH